MDEMIIDKIAGVPEKLQLFGVNILDKISNLSIVNPIFTFITILYAFFIRRPLTILYLKGPKIYNIGMWSGADYQDICQELTGVSSSHWLSNPEHCVNVIQKRFDAVIIGIWFITIILIVYKSIPLLYNYVSFKKKRQIMRLKLPYRVRHLHMETPKKLYHKINSN